MTREEVLSVLSALGAIRQEGDASWLRCVLVAVGAVLPHRPAAEEVPVRFLGHRIVVSLPQAAFTASKQMHLEGRFQHAMAQRGASAFLDFAPQWAGLETPLSQGFN